jgi:hypothetical protein
MTLTRRRSLTLSSLQAPLRASGRIGLVRFTPTLAIKNFDAINEGKAANERSADFTRWGWTPGRVSNLQCYMDKSGYGIENALSGLGVTNTVPPMNCRKVEHGTKSGREVVNIQRYYVDGKEYRVSQKPSLQFFMTSFPLCYV